MKIVLLANTRSGRGVAARAGAEFAAALRADGHEVEDLAVGVSHERLAMSLRGAALLLVAGGDGTVHKAVGDAMSSDVPIYHIPCGNENLLAREFGMDCSVAILRAAIRRWRVERVDVGIAEERGKTPLPFVLMCGVGPDAGVVDRLTSLRTRAIGHRAYVEPVIREVLHPRLPVMTIEVDGEAMVREAAGMLIVANSRQYGFRLDPAHLASMTDGALDAVFMPCTTSIGALRWLLRAGLRRGARFPELRYWRGREITVRAATDAPFQVDGDAPGAPGLPQNGHVPGAGLDLRLSIRPGALGVLVP